MQARRASHCDPDPMTTPVEASLPRTTEQRLRRAADPLVLALVVAQAVRIVAAVASALTDIARNDSGLPPGLGSRANLGVRLSDFGQAGTETGALILLLALALLWMSAPPVRETGGRTADRWRSHAFLVGWLLFLTALSALLLLAGALVELPDQDFFPAAHVIYIAGLAGATLVMCAAGIYVSRALLSSVDRAAADDDVTAPAAVFAIDRRNGDVLAWPSMRRAVEEAPVYGVDDDEYEFFLDDGTVLSAGLVEDRVQLTATGVERYDHLLSALQDYATRRGLVIDEDDVSEPLAYVDPVDRDHWLEMWPGWLRWIGRFVRPPR
jgi:hypothetical protein